MLSTATIISFEWGVAMTPVTDNERSETMSWNYRVIMLPKDAEDSFSEDTFVIREVFYDENDEIEFWMEEDSVPLGETFEELADDFDLMAEAFEKPILMLTVDEDGEEKLVEIEETSNDVDIADHDE